jgi:hypothetical protein
MVCSKCRTEYEDGTTECSDCRVALVDKLAIVPEAGELVPVFETADSAEAIVVKSLLESERIYHVSQNEILQDFFGAGRVGAGYNSIIGLIRILVAKADKNKAVQILKEMRRS